MLGNGVVVPFLPLYAQQFGAAGLGVGFLFSAHSASRTFLLPVIGKVSDRWGRKNFLLAGLLCYALSSVAFLLANSMVALILIMAFQGIATAMVQPVSMAYVGDLTPKGREGAYAGYVNTAFLGGVAGGPRCPFYCCCFFCRNLRATEPRPRQQPLPCGSSSPAAPSSEWPVFA